MEDILGEKVEESETKAVFDVFDIDGDGRIKIEDFGEALCRQAVDLSEQVLEVSNPEAIVDLKVQHTILSGVHTSHCSV
jgi:Ca2+-binding EF-hand superfamily protein